MKKSIWWLIAIIVVVIIVVVISSGSKKEAELIKIGFIGALTGDATEYGEPQRDVVILAVEEINKAGGIAGRQVEVIYENGECKGERGASAAQKLVNVDRVRVILGGTCSSETLAAIPIVEPAKVFLFTGSASSPDLTGKSKFFARDFPNDSTQGSGLAEIAAKKGWKKVAVINEQTDYAQGIVKFFEKRFTELGGTVVKEEFNSKIRDFRGQLAKLQSAKPDAILISTQTSSTGDPVVTQMQQLKWNTPIMMNDVLTTEGFTMAHKDFLEGAIMVDFYLDPADTKLINLNRAFKARFGKEMGFPTYSTAVYDSVYIIKDAIEAVGYDGEKIAEWVRTVKDWKGTSGSVTIGADGERSGGRVQKVLKDGKIVVVQ